MIAYRIFTTVLGLGLMTSMGAADTFHPISGLAAPNMTDGNPVGNPLRNIIQGAGTGFAAAPPHNATGGTWYTDDPGGFPSDYIASNDGDEILILDLGSDVVLGEISVWGYSADNGNGLRDFSVRFATDAEGGEAGLGDEDFGNSIPLNLPFTAALNPSPRQSFGFGEPVTARYVEVLITTNYYNLVVGGDRLGVGEIAFAMLTAAGAPDIDVPAEQPLALDTFPAEYDIPVRNTGDQVLTLGTPTFTGPNADAFSVVSVPPAFGTFLTENVIVAFDPTGLGGPVAATMTIPSDDPDEPSVEILLTGSLPPTGPEISVTSPAVLALGDLVESYYIDIDNTGVATLTITGTGFTGANAGAFTVTDAPTDIEAGGFATIIIEFDPAGLEAGPIDATLQIMSNDPVTPTAGVVLQGGVASTFHEISDVFTNTENFYSEFNLISGIGIGFDSYWPHNAIGSAQAATWVTNAPNGAGSYYDNGQPAPVLEFDLGGDRELGEISTWGYANGNTNGGKDFTLRFATEADGREGYGTSITYSPSFEAAFSATTRDSHLFEQTVTARYVEMTITTNWRFLQGGLAGGDRVGFGEVAFEVLPAIVPAPPFAVTGISVAADRVDLTFESTPSVIYNLERSVDGTTWDLLPGTAVGGAGATSVISDTDPPADAAVLYRVINTGAVEP